MDRLFTAALGLLVPSVGQNLQQDLTAAMRLASGSAITTQSPGLEGRIYQATADLVTGTLAIVDATTVSAVNEATSPPSLTTTAFDWSDREIVGFFRAMTGATQYPGGANDYQFDAGTLRTFWGYLGGGALNGAGGQVSAGNPPVPAAGTSWAILITTNVWLYLDGADGKLKIYNDTGSTLRTPALLFFATGATGARP